jgi:uncharacterized repeat protein (TIGR03803 family)
MQLILSFLKFKKQYSQVSAFLAFLMFSSLFYNSPATSQNLLRLMSQGGSDNLGTILKYNIPTGNTIVLHNMQSLSEGASPEENTEFVLFNAKFYGITPFGGGKNLGVIFEYDAATNIYTNRIELTGDSGSFQGSNPRNKLILYNNKFYGITQFGGENNAGVIFEWDPTTNIYTKKFDFNTLNGTSPRGIILHNNLFYGVTQLGGIYDKGVIFEWNPTTNLYTKKVDFNGVMGESPWGSPTFLNGKFYGMTQLGGINNLGVIYEWDATNNFYTKKLDFTGTSGVTIGANPLGSLSIFNNKFYGMTQLGGLNNRGVIFEWEPATNFYSKKIDFTGSSGAAIGEKPLSSLTLVNNIFYGVTSTGGINFQGVIFQWNPITNIYSPRIHISPSSSGLGMRPMGNLVFFGNTFWGMNSLGGTYFKGTIFEWNPTTNIFTKKLDFNSQINGSIPFSNLTFFKGKFYGTTAYGGTKNLGTLFEYDPVTKVYTKKLDFIGSNGQYPNSVLYEYNNKLYGTVNTTGIYPGLLFEWDPLTNIFVIKLRFQDVVGNQPSGKLTLNGDVFYGTTYGGGEYRSGVLFEWNPITNTYTKKLDLKGSTGVNILSELVSFGNSYYGIAESGGSNNLGFIFEWNPTTNIYTPKIDFNTFVGTGKGVSPIGKLTPWNNKFYGVTSEGGINDYGVIFEWDPITNTYTKKFNFDENIEGVWQGDLILVNNKFYGLSDINGKTYVVEWDPITNIMTKKGSFSQEKGIAPYGSFLLSPKINQVINFNPLESKKLGDIPFNLSANSTSELPITFSSSNQSVATVKDNIITIIGVGTTNITASQLGNDEFNEAPIKIQSLTVNCAESIFNTSIINISDITNNSALISWDKINGANNYNLSYKSQDSIDWIILNTSSSSYTLTNLSFGIQYQVKIQGKCNDNTSNYSEIFHFTTLGCSPPININGIVIGNSITLTWDSFPNAIGYKIRYRIVNSSTWTYKTVNQINNNLQVLGGLQTGISYEVQINSNCGASNSLYSSSKIFTISSNCTTPAIPNGIIITNITQTSAEINWSLLPNISHYQFRYRINGATSWNTINLITNSYKIPNLFSGTKYQFNIRASCGNQNSNFSSNLIFTTLGEPICPRPSNILLTNVGADKASISWSAIIQSNQYEISIKSSNSSNYPSNIITNSSNYNFIGLNPNTTYNVRVRSVCNSPLISEYTYKTFKTLNNTLIAKNDINLRLENISNTNTNVYPIPTKDFITIELPRKESIDSQLIDIQLFNILGELILHYPKQINETDELIIDLRDFKSGIYTLNIILHQTQNVLITKKIIKQ